jgi:outer membrane receptor protein involved in Fe transport
MRNRALIVVLLAVLPRIAAGQSSQDPPPPTDDESPAPEETQDGEPPTYAETIVITASRTEESLLDVPVSTTVIPKDQLETAPSDSYADLLRSVPGVNVVQTSARDINIVSRGSASTLATAQLALLDGRSIYQDFFGFVMWDLLPVGFDEVSQVEVLRGPGSAVWGANALAGVINVRTKSPRETPGGSLSLGAGEQGMRTAAARWAQAFKRGSYRIAGSWFEQDAWPRSMTQPDGTPLPPEASFVNEGSEQPKLDLRFDWDPSEGRNWSYRAGESGTSGIMHTGIGPFTIDPSTRQSYGEASFNGKKLEMKVYLNQIDGDAKNLLNGIDFAFLSDTWVGDATWHFTPTQRNLLLMGGNVRLNRFDLSLAPGEDKRDEAGAFVEDQVFFGEKGILSAGARLDWFDTVGTALSPRLSYVWKPRPHQSLRFAYNRAYRAPSLINNFLHTAVPNLVVLDPANPPLLFVTFAEGNAKLKEEVVDALEIGYTAEVGKSTFTAAVYQNRTQDLIDFYPAVYYSPSDPPIGWPLPPQFVPPRTLPKLFTYRNVGKTLDQGIELSVNTAWRPGFSTIASYAFQDGTKATKDDPTEPLNLNIPSKHQVSLMAIVVGHRWRGQASLSYTDDAYWTDVLDQRFWGWTKDFVLLGGSVGRENEHFGFKVSATNLLDQDVQQHVFGDVVGRVVSAEVKYRF